VANELRERGHQPVVFARRPSRRKGVEVVVGDVLDPEAVTAAVSGADAAVCTLGLPTRLAMGPPFAPRSYVLTQGTANILSALQAAGVRRFICETAIASGDSRAQCTPLARWGLRYGLRWLFKQKDQQEQLVQESTLDWTIVRPSALTNGPDRSDAAPDVKFKIGLFTHISRREVARLIVDELEDPQFIGQAITISRPPRLGDSWRWIKEYKSNE